MADSTEASVMRPSASGRPRPSIHWARVSSHSSRPAPLQLPDHSGGAVKCPPPPSIHSPIVKAAIGEVVRQQQPTAVDQRLFVGRFIILIYDPPVPLCMARDKLKRRLVALFKSLKGAGCGYNLSERESRF